MFLDGDDYLESDCCEKAYGRLVEQDVELVMFDQFVNYPNSQIVVHSFNDGEGSRLFMDDECMSLQARVLDFNGEIAMVFMKLIRLDFLQRNGIRHVDELKQGAEGFVFNIQLFEYLKKAYYLKEPLLHYVYNGGSISHMSSVTNNRLIVHCMEWIDEYVKHSRNVFDLHASVLHRMLYIICTTAITGYFNPYNSQPHSEKVKDFKSFMSEPLVRMAMNEAPYKGLDTQRKMILYLIRLKQYRVLALLGRMRRKQLESK